MVKKDIDFQPIENLEGQMNIFEEKNDPPTTNIGGVQYKKHLQKNKKKKSLSLENSRFIIEKYNKNQKFKDMFNIIQEKDRLFIEDKEGNSVNGYKIDWLSLTVPVSFFLDDFLKDFGYNIDDFEECPGRNFYNSGITLGGYVNVFFNQQGKKIFASNSDSFNVVFTGQGMTDLYNRNCENREDFFNILRLMKYKYRVKIARLDLAFDDFTGIFDFIKIENKLNNGEYKSSKRSYNIVKSNDVNGNVLSKTIYIGKARSSSSKVGNSYARFYDKLAQYIEKNQIVPDIVELTGIWQRAEISFTKKKADEIMEYMINETNNINNVEDYIFRSTMKNIIEFLDPTKKQKMAKILRRETWNKSKWWQEYLNGVEEYKFISFEKDVNLFSSLSWINEAVVPMISLIVNICEQNDIDFFEYLEKYVINFESNTEKPLTKKQKRFLTDGMNIPKKQLKVILDYFLNNEKKGGIKDYV